MKRTPYDDPREYNLGNFKQERQKITSYMFAIYRNFGFTYTPGDENTNFSPFIQMLGCRQIGKTSEGDLDRYGRSIHHLYSGRLVNVLPEFLWHIEDRITEDRFHPLNTAVFINDAIHKQYEELRRNNSVLFEQVAHQIAKLNTEYLYDNIGDLKNEKRFCKSVNPYHIDDIEMAFENLQNSMQIEM